VIAHVADDLTVQPELREDRHTNQRNHKRRPERRDFRIQFAEPQRKRRPQRNRQHDGVRRQCNQLFFAPRQMIDEIVQQLWNAHRHGVAPSRSGSPARIATHAISSGAIARQIHPSCQCGMWIHAHASGINQTMKNPMNIVVARP
jgi:hypothetical protein